MIAIVDTGGANLSSVSNALDRMDRSWCLTADADRIQQATHVILPGVGAAKDSMLRLQKLELEDLIPRLTQPTLGICLGMQLLFSHCEEGNVEGLGVLSGRVREIPRSPGLRIPHMGWNTLDFVRTDCPLTRAISKNDHFYFVHSFCGDSGPWGVATTGYGVPLVALVQQDNFFGAQFHPERSGTPGAQLLTNFVNL